MELRCSRTSICADATRTPSPAGLNSLQSPCRPPSPPHFSPFPSKARPGSLERDPRKQASRVGCTGAGSIPATPPAGRQRQLDSPRRTPSPARSGCSWRAPVGPRRSSVGVGRFRGDAPGDFSAGLRQGAPAGALHPPGGTAATREAAATPATSKEESVCSTSRRCKSTPARARPGQSQHSACVLGPGAGAPAHPHRWS